MKIVLAPLLSLLLFCCSKNNGTATPVETRDLLEQSLLDDQALRTYLETHYYNYEEFNEINDNQSLSITIDSITNVTSGKTPLLNQVVQQKIIIEDNGKPVEHQLYYLVARQGIGSNPTKVDSIYASYEGKLLDGKVFDKQTLPIWLDLLVLVRGFSEGVTHLKHGEFELATDGTVSFNNFGQVALFMPSGLAYFSRATSEIPEYAPLIFEVKLYTISTADHDNDQIPSKLEDVNNDGNFFNDDTDNNNIPNVYDPDDDGDGILTRDEYDRDNDGMPDDLNNNGIPDYLERN